MEKMAPTKKSHTIILVQFTNDFSSRTFMDFPTTASSLDALVKMYETRLKELNPRQSNITYDINHLYQYLDSLEDIRCLTLGTDSKYLPHDRAWIKEHIFSQLKGQAS